LENKLLRDDRERETVDESSSISSSVSSFFSLALRAGRFFGGGVAILKLLSSLRNGESQLVFVLFRGEPHNDDDEDDDDDERAFDEDDDDDE
jgi:hypothetical protein